MWIIRNNKSRIRSPQGPYLVVNVPSAAEDSTTALQYVQDWEAIVGKFQKSHSRGQVAL